MSRIVAALVMFALGLFVGINTKDGFTTGSMPALIWKEIVPLRFDRITAPAWFWGAATINVALTAIFVLGGVLFLVAGR